MPAMPSKPENSPFVAWQTAAILLLLATQVVLVALLCSKVFVPPPQAAPPNSQRLEAAADKINAALIGLEDRRRSEFTGKANGSDPERLQALCDRAARLDDDVEARDAQIRELQGQLNEARDKILILDIAAKRNEERLKSLNDSLREESGKLAGGKR